MSTLSKTIILLSLIAISVIAFVLLSDNPFKYTSIIIIGILIVGPFIAGLFFYDIMDKYFDKKYFPKKNIEFRWHLMYSIAFGSLLFILWMTLVFVFESIDILMVREYFAYYLQNQRTDISSYNQYLFNWSVWALWTACFGYFYEKLIQRTFIPWLQKQIQRRRKRS